MRRILSVLVLFSALAASPVAHAWTWPAAGPVLRPFSLGPDSYASGQHRGIDIGAERGSPVLAPAAGTVSFVGSIPHGGRAVTIQTPDGYAVTLLQLGSTSVARGSLVAEGAVVGDVGESRDAVTSEPHVHLGVRVAADPDGYVDPLSLLPVRPPASVPASSPPVPKPHPVETQPTEPAPAAAADPVVPVPAAAGPVGPAAETPVASAEPAASPVPQPEAAVAAAAEPAVSLPAATPVVKATRLPALVPRLQVRAPRSARLTEPVRPLEALSTGAPSVRAARPQARQAHVPRPKAVEGAPRVIEAWAATGSGRRHPAIGRGGPAADSRRRSPFQAAGGGQGRR